MLHLVLVLAFYPFSVLCCLCVVDDYCIRCAIDAIMLIDDYRFIFEYVLIHIYSVLLKPQSVFHV